LAPQPVNDMVSNPVYQFV